MKDSLSVAVLTQLVGSPSRGNRINLVNAAAFAKSKGILVALFLFLIDCDNFATSAALAEVRAVLSASLVQHRAE